MGGFLILVLILGAAWLLIIVPTRRRRQSHSAMQESVDLGDEIITAGGLHGFVREIDDDTLRIEIAPNVVVTLDRRAVAAVAREVEVEVEPEDNLENSEEDHKNGTNSPKSANETPPEPG